MSYVHIYLPLLIKADRNEGQQLCAIIITHIPVSSDNVSFEI